MAVFVRFAGCNLWSGREKDRTAAIRRFCDTEFVGGRRYGDAEQLAEVVAAYWPVGDRGRRFCVLTGGEPLLQVDPALIAAPRGRHFTIAVETNGTVPCRRRSIGCAVRRKPGRPWRSGLLTN